MDSKSLSFPFLENSDSETENLLTAGGFLWYTNQKGCGMIRFEDLQIKKKECVFHEKSIDR